jgi:hypothetical protein
VAEVEIFSKAFCASSPEARVVKMLLLGRMVPSVERPATQYRD